ncbi:MAG: UDP-glucose/GDP-mannose dehydrogenase family protein [Propionibacteriaceae bacterium]|jgi:UDPglucose 6-dehydrogenase|nr:UDP-glucose/GDP-mannose dehydrogenase family protein [Propionibacteriaceae bacterium]
MRLSVVGCGYLGAVHAVAMAALGHEVVGIDIDAARIEPLARGQAPFFEPGFQDLLDEVRPTGRLSFSTRIEDAADREVHFLCVGTPQRPDSLAADLTYVDAAVESLAAVLAPGGRPGWLVGKSTVPVGTAERIAGRLRLTAPQLSLLWNPEFLREGFAVNDTLHPDRIVYGVAPGAAGQAATAVLDRVYAALLADGTPRLAMDYATAQLVKVAANSFLAVKISFINAMAVLCQAAGGDVGRLAEAIGLDDRIGPKFLRAGLGYGGGCLPKDVRALVSRAEELGAGEVFAFLREVDQVNSGQRTRFTAQAAELLGGQLRGRRIALLGAAFKPDSDDVRDSPALTVAQQLTAAGAVVRIYDPAVAGAVIRAKSAAEAAGSLEAAVAGADLVAVATEWPEFRTCDPIRLAELAQGRLVLDGRCCLDAARWRAAGWTVVQPGVASEPFR